jgi:hypothetical protein
MPTVFSEAEVKRNALLAFFDFHRRFADGSFRVVKMSAKDLASEIGREPDSFTENDVECQQVRDGWICTVRHLHLSKTQKGMPRVFEYKVRDDPSTAKYDCRAVG